MRVYEQVYEYYVKQMEEGTFAWRMLPYGYRWNEDHTGIVPYEPEAKYVRKVFQWKLEGKSVLKISDLLDEEGAPFYRDGAFNKEGIWQHGSLFGMLTNPAYVGDRVYGIRHSAIYKGIKLEKRPEEEWYVIPNDHPPIIDRDTFYAVKEIMKKDSDKRAESMKKTAKEREKLIDLFRGKIFCKDCGGKMYFHRHQMDCKDFYRKFMRDLREDQLRYCDGNLPMFSPSLKGKGGKGGAV